MSDTKTVPEELAELTEAVRELRDRQVADEIKALREEIERLRAKETAPAPSCCGHHHCGCVHWHYWPSLTYPYTVTYTQPATLTMGASGAANTGTYMASNMTAGGGTTYSLT
jgi:hypothetical protein